MPKSVAIRLRRNCSNKEMYIEDCKKYKGYLLTSGYNEMEIDEAFANSAMVKRNILLKEKKKKRKDSIRKYRFVTDHEPAFPDIHKIMKTNQDTITNDKKLCKIFPNGTRDFQVSFRRGSPNIKEILAPSKITLRSDENQDELVGSFACDKNCRYCEPMRETQGNKFKSNNKS